MLIGLDAVSAYSKLIEGLSEVSRITVFEYQSPPPLQSRLKNSTNEAQLLQKALEIRQNYKAPFWDALLLACFSVEDVPSAILDAAALHVSHRNVGYELDRNDVATGKLRELAATCASDSSLAVISEVEIANGSRCHLPLVDFHVPFSNVNTEIVRYISEKLLPGGFVLLNSGRSYHLWGTTLVDQTQMSDLLAHALLYCPIIDRAYLAHQLIEGRSALRISRYRDKPAPQVILSTPF